MQAAIRELREIAASCGGQPPTKRLVSKQSDVTPEAELVVTFNLERAVAMKTLRQLGIERR